jgi:general stress protein CsbA
MAVRSPESRRISSLLGERKVSGVAMVVVLSISLVCGLIGFAIHTSWVVAIMVLALGLGYVFANTRRDRRDIIDRRPEDVEPTA